MTTLMNDILDFAKLESGKVDLNPEPITLNIFLEDIVSTIRTQTDEKSLLFIFEKTNELPLGVKVDEARLRQILLNLLDNAVKFTNKGQVVFQVESKEITNELKTDLCLLHFEVKDTGIGIPPEQIKNLFVPFTKTGELRLYKERTKLGLRISRQLVRLMGGDLFIESDQGHGSLFWFEITVPITQPILDKPLSSNKNRITGYDGPKQRILVVDDNPSNRETIVDMLNMMGFESAEAENGMQAIQMAQKFKPHLILMDRWMPVLEGDAATQHIHHMPEFINTPIICISASVSIEDQKAIQEANFNDFLSKPIHLSSLTALLEKHLLLKWHFNDPEDASHH